MIFERTREGRNGRMKAKGQKPSKVKTVASVPRSSGATGTCLKERGNALAGGKDNMVKRIQVYGGCLGAGRRRRP